MRDGHEQFKDEMTEADREARPEANCSSAGPLRLPPSACPPKGGTGRFAAVLPAVCVPVPDRSKAGLTVAGFPCARSAILSVPSAGIGEAPEEGVQTR